MTVTSERFSAIVRYTFSVARGWESKSVEDQQALFAESRNSQKRVLPPAELARRQVLDGLILNRKRIVQQLETAQNAERRVMLETSLSFLDAEIARLTK